MRLAPHRVLTLSSFPGCTAGIYSIAWNCIRLWSAACGPATSSVPAKLHVCVVGSGPAGFYTVDRLLKRYGDKVHVSILDRLPNPFGLVRSGVAPDHQDTKNVTNQFSSLATDPRVSFLGNVLVGRDLDVSELRALHHAVVLAYGAESDRRLGISGEEDPTTSTSPLRWSRGGGGVFSAREFVWWYNGHPDARHLPIDLSKVRSVAICGIGNVALDCARVLLSPPDRYTPTDLAAHARSQLQGLQGGLGGGVQGGGASSSGGSSSSGVREVHLVARRGPVQAACTPKELKELLTECGVSARTGAPDQLMVSEADAAEMKATRLKRRVYELVSKAVAEAETADGATAGQRQQQQQQQQQGPSRRDLFFQFYRNPVEIVRGPDGGVTGLRVERTVVQPDGPGGTAVAVGSGVYDTIECQLVLKSIGYKSLPLHGVAFDSRRGVIPNLEGRVLKQAPANGTAVSATDEGLYVVGWLKRGPTGIIGTNLVDAEETVACVAADTEALLRAGEKSHGSAGPPGLAGLTALLRQRGVRVVDWRRWRLLDEHEVATGRAAGRVREKVTEVKEMLRVCGFSME